MIPYSDAVALTWGEKWKNSPYATKRVLAVLSDLRRSELFNHYRIESIYDEGRQVEGLLLRSNGLSETQTNGHAKLPTPAGEGLSETVLIPGVPVETRKPVERIYFNTNDAQAAGVPFDTPGLFTPETTLTLEEILEQFYLQHHADIYNLLYYKLNGNHHLAQDLAGATFEKLIRRIRSGSFVYRGSIPFSDYCYTTANNTFIDEVRSYKHIHPPLRVEDFRDYSHPDYPQNNLESSIALREALTTLASEAQRKVIYLRFIQGFSTKETALALGKSEDVVKKLLARGLPNLRKILKSSGFSS